MLADGASGIHVVFKTARNCPYFRKNGENPFVVPAREYDRK